MQGGKSNKLSGKQLGRGAANKAFYGAEISFAFWLRLDGVMEHGPHDTLF